MPGGAPRLEKTALRSATTSETCAEATPMAVASTEARFKTYVHHAFDSLTPTRLIHLSRKDLLQALR